MVVLKPTDLAINMNHHSDARGNVMRTTEGGGFRSWEACPQGGLWDSRLFSPGPNG